MLKIYRDGYEKRLEEFNNPFSKESRQNRAQNKINSRVDKTNTKIANYALKVVSDAEKLYNIKNSSKWITQAHKDFPSINSSLQGEEAYVEAERCKYINDTLKKSNIDLNYLLNTLKDSLDSLEKNQKINSTMNASQISNLIQKIEHALTLSKRYESKYSKDNNQEQQQNPQQQTQEQQQGKDTPSTLESIYNKLTGKVKNNILRKEEKELLIDFLKNHINQ